VSRSHRTLTKRPGPDGDHRSASDHPARPGGADRRRRRRVPVALALALGVLGALLLVLGLTGSSLAQPSDDEADVFVARALVAYAEKHFEDALAALHEALELAPNHVDALYYTGLTLVALRRLDEAIAPLEKARSGAPKDEAILFQLGTVYFALEKYDQAQPLLEEVFAVKPKLDTLGYYVGFLRYRRNDFQGALKAFGVGAASDPEVQQLTRFYTGLALRALGFPERAAAEIEEALRLQPASPLAGPAERVREALTATRAGEGRFRAELRLGGFYDNNVPIIPGVGVDPTLDFLRGTRRESFGELAALRLEYTFFRAGSLDAAASYAFFGTHNETLPRFDLVDHLGGLTANYRGVYGGLPYYSTLQYTYDYATLGGRAFVQRHIGSSYLSLAENPFNLTTLQLRYQDRWFFTDSAAARADRRSGPNSMVGLTHLFRFEQDKYLIRLGYQWDWEDTKGRNFAYFGHRLLAGAQYTLPWASVRLNYDLDVHLRSYINRNTVLPIDAPNTIARADTEITQVFGLTVPLPRGLSLAWQYQLTDVHSNLSLFTYSRNINSVFVIWTY
jgi:tetratricopeptide (TPR) repeat protein